MAMKRYLNRDEKNIALTLGALISYMETQVKRWTELKRPKDLIKYAKMARTFADKTLTELFRGLDTTELACVVAETKKMQVVTRYSNAALSEYKDFLALDSVTPVKTDDLLDMVDQTLQVCKTCRKESADVEACRLRQIFVQYHIPGYYNQVPVEYCVYQYRDYYACKCCGDYFEPVKGGQVDLCRSCHGEARSEDLAQLQEHFRKGGQLRNGKAYR